jgi:glycosyltransferase involved in cell wall biosynthesis
VASPENKQLTVLIANHNTSGFLELSLHAIHELTASSVAVLVHDDGSDAGDVEALRELVERYPEVRVFERPPSQRGGSFAHGEALDFLFGHVESEYAAVLDADCTPLMRGWDEYLIGQLDERTKIVGSRLGEGGAINKPNDFPLPFLALFESETYRRLGISALPEDPAKGRDSCWEWRAKYTASGYSGKTLHSINTRYTPEGPFRDVVCGVYSTDDGRVIGSHFGRGSNPVGKRSALPRRVDDALRRLGVTWVFKREWRRQRDRWKEVCRQLIDEQAATPAAAAASRDAL